MKPIDNYVVFQVTLDGVPMHGHSVFYDQPRHRSSSKWRKRI